MAAHVSFLEVAKILGAGASFLGLATGLGFGFAHFQITALDAAGRLRLKPCAVISLAFAMLVVAHTMALWWLDLYHPAVSAFYAAGAAIAFITTRAKTAVVDLRPK